MANNGVKEERYVCFGLDPPSEGDCSQCSQQIQCSEERVRRIQEEEKTKANRLAQRTKEAEEDKKAGKKTDKEKLIDLLT